MISLVELKKLTLVHLGIAVTFFVSGLIINLVQLILYVALKPFNTKLFRHIMYYLCYSLYSQLIFVAEWYANSNLHLYMDPNDLEKLCGKEHVMIIQNHSYEIDWLCGWMFADKVGCLGNCKAYAKKVISYVPVMGWAWKFAEFVFLERSFDKDSEIIARQLKEIFDYPDPVWLLLNAEGTRFTPKKHEASVKFAQERGLPVLKHHLVPRTKGFTTSLPTMRGRCVAIYDTTLAFKRDAKNSPTISTLLNGLPVEGHMFARRIPLESVPEDETAAAEWLHNLYREKDRLVDSFLTTGNFCETSGIKEVPVTVFKYRTCSLLNFACWAIFSISLILYYLVSSFLSQNWIGLSIALGVLLTIYMLMIKSINMSKISKASSYGSESKTDSKSK
ncbi:PREDICTED: 1-acyl-sn-glycerol-3-phosphate acyltransferase gamma-like [Rhagoletis zephyria]|uniref:1-acyl-sn-glycerol-3-phosphate acyltransferase gamma-like n=1 Tax=Rhagoletis zephyria TaxID=28612 RepID=UPI0008115028|nr:PREDICTED: 1-acyl-sn-glycerol-3-phosphate acyltransferase gamma-like [Rhagoletis zephyria]XP_017477792.1 PREDICTED: 1-acyl-sn-glycerol-3-phosphate acyltransferase gamma-like [Rhagoletis zephyria]XP_017477793.1 PREDICTED: 1-acyl-sn-glycerol-3-phosphate acyltransferase gamma-like [Rhagoletis zephyria]XP_017477795.1 PREDICTED: 1-acyl-sn-glycerol-3-phosphate acyltransferase gamma-like [Rhagoletis zephyria]XP_017477796.1 PREDICTED: 1-acyl-sn-glycerol-3-phosphate acyltransferase gamma-like [Rhagol